MVQNRCYCWSFDYFGIGGNFTFVISISFTASSPYKVDAASVGQRAFTIFGSELNILNLKRTKGLSTFFVRASVLFRLACYELIVF